MKLEWNRKYTTIAVYAFLVIAASIIFYLVLSDLGASVKVLEKIVSPIMPIIYGFVLAYLLNPIMVWMEKRLLKLELCKKMKFKQLRALSLCLTYLITITVLVIMLLIVLPKVIVNISTLYEQLQYYVLLAERSVNYFVNAVPHDMVSQEYIDQVSQLAGESIQKLINWMAVSAPRLVSFVWQLGSGIITAFVAVIVSIYFLAAKERFIAQLRKAMLAFFPERKVRRAAAIINTAHGMFGGFITGKIVDSIIIGILCFVGLSIMKMPNAVLVSFIVGVTNVLPYFGPFIGAVPGFILITIISPIQGLIFLVFILVLQQIDGNIIGPMILGDSIGLSAFWVVFAILFFGGIFGILGMFIGVPTFGVIYALVRECVYAKLIQRNMSTETAAYLAPLDTSKK